MKLKRQKMCEPRFKKGDWVRVNDSESNVKIDTIGTVLDVFPHPELHVIYQVRTSPTLTQYLHEGGLEHVHKKAPRALA